MYIHTYIHMYMSGCDRRNMGLHQQNPTTACSELANCSMISPISMRSCTRKIIPKKRVILWILQRSPKFFPREESDRFFDSAHDVLATEILRKSRFLSDFCSFSISMVCLEGFSMGIPTLSPRVEGSCCCCWASSLGPC